MAHNQNIVNHSEPYADWFSQSISGGSAALSIAGELVTGSTLTINTDGTFDFGAVGPELVCLYDTSNVDESGNLVPVLGPNTTVDSGVFPVESVPQMPNGAGYKMLQSSRNWVSCVAHSRGFESRTFYWPESARVLARSYLLDTGTDGDNKDWQIKPVWNMADKTFNGADTDFYIINNERFFSGTKTWYSQEVLSSNSVPTVYGANLTYQPSSSPAHEPLPEAHTTEFFWDQVSTTFDGLAFYETLTSSPSVGPHYAKSRQENTTLHKSSGATKQINSFSYPGYIRGFGAHDVAMATYDGEFYKAAGVGAACRVVISDHADVEQASKKVILEVETWGSSQVTAKLRSGWWRMADLIGKYVCIIGADNNQISSVQIVGT